MASSTTRSYIGRLDVASQAQDPDCQVLVWLFDDWCQEIGLNEAKDVLLNSSSFERAKVSADAVPCIGVPQDHLSSIAVKGQPAPRRAFRWGWPQGAWPARKSAGGCVIDWPEELARLKATGLDLKPSFAPMAEDTLKFVSQADLREGIVWLQSTAPHYFPNAGFQVDVFVAEEGEESMLSLEVYASFPPDEFRERRHRLCEAMLDAGHRRLYMTISIFQRRIARSGCEGLSWYRTASPE